MTARKPRPVVRVVVDIFPSYGFGSLCRLRAWVAAELWDRWGNYRRPRVVSIKAVRGARK